MNYLIGVLYAEYFMQHQPYSKYVIAVVLKHWICHLQWYKASSYRC